MCSYKLLVHFDPCKHLVLSCDASAYGVGCVLEQANESGKSQPVAYASRSLTKAERADGMVDKVALGCVFGETKMHQCLFGRKFELETDHKPLTFLFSENKAINTNASSRVQRWALTLSGYNYTIRSRPSTGNCADTLSQLPVLITDCNNTPQPADLVLAMNVFESDTSLVTAAQVRLWSHRDPVLSVVKRCVMTGDWSGIPDSKECKPYLRHRDELSVRSECLFWGRRVIKPKQGRDKLVSELHNTHPGIVTMKAITRFHGWWPGIDSELEFCIHCCDTWMQLSKSPAESPLSLWSWPSINCRVPG